MDFSELLVLMVIALILFGPEDLPKIARAIGKAVYAIRKLAQEFTQELQNAAADPVNAVNKAMEYTPEQKSKPSQAKNAEPKYTDKGKPVEELLVYEENGLSGSNAKKEQSEDPLAVLPCDMVTYEEEGVSR